MASEKPTEIILHNSPGVWQWGIELLESASSTALGLGGGEARAGVLVSWALPKPRLSHGCSKYWCDVKIVK